MSGTNSPNAYGTLIEPATLKIQRLLPGPIERVWAYLTDSDLRSQWLAAGEMDMKVGSTFEFVWHNDELTDPPGKRPAGLSEENRLQSQITELEPPHKLAITWGSTGGVSFELEPQSDNVLLTVTHHRATDRSTLLGVSAGWHAHLDVLAARITDVKPKAFWDEWSRLREEYERRFQV